MIQVFNAYTLSPTPQSMWPTPYPGAGISGGRRPGHSSRGRDRSHRWNRNL